MFRTLSFASATTLMLSCGDDDLSRLYVFLVAVFVISTTVISGYATSERQEPEGVTKSRGAHD